MAVKLPSRQNETRLPTLDDASPRYTALVQRQRAISERMEANRAAFFPLLDKGVLTNSHASIAKQKTKSEEERATEERIRRLLGDAAPEDATPQEVVEPASDRKTADELVREYKDLEAARLIIGKQIDEERRAASRKIIPELEPKHRTLVDSLINAMLALHEANRMYADFIDHVNSNRISWGELQVLAPWFVGDPRSKESEMAKYLYEASSLGFLPQESLPFEFRS